MIRVDSLLASLELEPVGTDSYRASSIRSGHPIVYGGQLLAQSVVAGALGHDGKTVKTLHTVFVAPASPEHPLDVVVDPMHRGRGFASSTVTITQADRTVARSLVLLSADEPDFIRHGDRRDDLAVPAVADDDGTWQTSIVDDVDVSDPDAVGPAQLDVWSRMPGAPADALINQALLAFATDFFLIATAMRPHAGVGQAQAHVTLTTGVVSHTLTFHEPVDAGEWQLLSHASPHAGRGRSYGRADVFRADGELVASYVQDSMIRPMARPTG